MRKLSITELKRLTPEEYRQAGKRKVIVVLDNVRSLNNVGSVFRTADAFMVEAIFLCGITGTPPHREINKTALGATESVPWRYFEETSTAVNLLRQEGYVIVAVEQAEGSVKLASFNPVADIKYAVILGHEIEGVNQAVIDMCDFCAEITQFGTKHSLNIAVTAGIVLWEFAGKRD